jgi:hypothetical protein
VCYSNSYLFQISLKPLSPRLCSYPEYTPLHPKAPAQFLPGAVPHKAAAHTLTIDGVGGRHHSDSLLICLTSISSCLRVSNCCVWYPWAVERVLPRNRLLRVLLLTLNFLAASDIFSDSEDSRNPIALSMEAMVVKISRVEARCCRASKVCTSQGCARAREDVYLSGKILESRRDFPRDTRVALAIGACRMSLGDHTASRRHCSLPGSVYILYRSQLRFSVQCQEMTLAMLPLRTKDA